MRNSIEVTQYLHIANTNKAKKRHKLKKIIKEITDNVNYTYLKNINDNEHSIKNAQAQSMHLIII